MENRIRNDDIFPNRVNKAVKLQQNIKTLPCMTLFYTFLYIFAHRRIAARLQLQESSATFDKVKRLGIMAIKIEELLSVHFFSVLFTIVAVAVVVKKCKVS